MSGSGSEALLRSFKESQTKSKLKERRMQIKKEGNVDDGSPGSSIGGIELDHIAIKRDLEPSNDQTLTIHERVGGSSIPPDDRSGEELIPSALRSLEEEVVIKAEDIRAEMSNTTSKAGKRKSTGTVVGVETIKGVDEGRVMTRGKKARLSQAAAKEEVVPLDEAVMILGRSGPIPWVEKASTPTTTTTQQVNGTYESADWRDEAYDARDSLPGYPTAGPSNPHARLSFAGPSTRPSHVELEKKVMDGIYANMNDTTMINASMNDTTTGNTSLDESMIKGKRKGKASLNTKGKVNGVPPAGEVRSGRWRKK